MEGAVTKFVLEKFKDKKYDYLQAVLYGFEKGRGIDAWGNYYTLVLIDWMGKEFVRYGLEFKDGKFIEFEVDDWFEYFDSVDRHVFIAVKFNVIG